MSSLKLFIVAYTAVLCVAGSPFADAAERWQVVSPNKEVSLSVQADQKSKGLTYVVSMKGKKTVATGDFGIDFVEPGFQFGSGLSFVGSRKSTINETYPMVSGKKSLHRNHANETILSFKNAARRTMDLVLRAYDDGVAFRYLVAGDGPITLAKELTNFRINKPVVGFLQKFRADYEAHYDETALGVKAPEEVAVPALFDVGNDSWVLLTEASVYGNFAGSRLIPSGGIEDAFGLQVEGKVNSYLPLLSPWRTLIVTKGLNDLVSSVLVDNLNPASEVTDTSWIKPGRSTFAWWSDQDANASETKMKRFADFASEMGWEWLEFDTGLITETHPKNWLATDEWMKVKWVPEFVKYAADKGLKVYGWDHWLNLDTHEKRERMFSYFNKIGIKGVKIDFMDSDSQARYVWTDDAVRDCLKHKLMLSLHGATLPRGQRRRWPHIMSWEGVMGAEYYQAWSKVMPTPKHNATLPFTRNVVGPMDYTGATLSAKKKTTTVGHELALSVLFESGWQNLADSPESFRASVGKEFLKLTHAAWDEVRFVAGYPGKLAVLARRSGTDWFIAGVNGGAAQEVTLPLGFMKPGKYNVDLYTDDASGTNIVVKSTEIDTTKTLSLSLLANGGFVFRVASSYSGR